MFGKIFDHNRYSQYQRTTSDATATTVNQLSMPEEQTMMVTAEATTRNADGSKNGVFKVTAGFYRNASGNVTILGDMFYIHSEVTDGSTIDLTLVANTSAETVDIKVTGETSETFSWDIKVANSRVNL